MSATKTPPSSLTIPAASPSPLVYLALLAAGIVLNQFPYCLFFNIDLLFGSIFSLLIIRLFGPPQGIAAAILISGSTFFLWRHPYAILILTAEATAVGLLHRRYGLNLLFADMFYWLFLGMPLAYVFYGVVMEAQTSTCIIMIKQAANGVTNALLADLLFYGWMLRSQEKIPLRELPANLLAAFTLLPTLIIFMFTGRQDYADAQVEVHNELGSHARQVEQILSNWLDDRHSALLRLAQMDTKAPAQRLQQSMDTLLRIDRNFEQIWMVDNNDRIIATAPSIDDQGRPLIDHPIALIAGTAFMNSQPAPRLAGMAWSEAGAPGPVIFVHAPLGTGSLSEGSFGGQIQLSRLMPFLNSICSKTYSYTLLDQSDRVVISNRPNRPLMTSYQWGPGKFEQTPSGLLEWIPKAPPNTPYSERWSTAMFVVQLPVANTPGWTLLVEQPVHHLQTILYSRYSIKLAFLFAIVLVCLGCSALISKRIVAALTELNNWSGALVQHIQHGHPPLQTPSSRSVEWAILIDHFKKMGTELKSQFAAVRKMNLLLEQRVDERTRSLRASYDLFQCLTASVPVGIFQADIKGQLVFVNDHFCELSGLPLHKTLASDWLSALHPDDSYRIRHAWASSIAVGAPFFGAEFRIVTPDGRTRWVSSIAKRLETPTAASPSYIGCVVDLTERKQIESAFSEHSTNLSNLIETTNDLVVVSDPAGRILFCNLAFRRTLGYEQQELVALRLFDLYPPEIRAAVSEQYTQLKQGEPLTIRCAIAKRQGRSLPVSARLTKGAWNGADCIFGFMKDLSEEHEARHLFSRIFHNNPALMALTSLPDRRLVDVNASFEQILGYAKEEVLGKTAVELSLFVSAEQREQALEALCQHNRLNEMVVQIRCKNGAIVDGLLTSEKIHSHGQDFWLTVMLDITPWKQARETLQQRESYLTAIIDNLPGLVWLKDEQSRILTVNTAYAYSCGRKTPEELAGRFDMDLWPRKMAEGYMADDLRVLESGQPMIFEELIADRGTPKWFETFKAPVFDSQGHILGTAGYARDITERRQAERRLLESRERLLTATAAAQLGVYSIEFKTGEPYYSPQFLAHHGLKSGAPLELDNDLAPRMLHPDDKPEFLSRIRAANTPDGDGVIDHEYRIIRPDGAIRWLRLVGRTVFSDDDGPPRPLRSTGILQDLSERKEMEQALRDSRAQAVAANAEKTTLLSSVAHEFRTPISLLYSSLDILERYGARLNQEQRRTQKQYLRNAVNQLKHLVDTTLAFNRTGGARHAIKPTPVDLGEFCATICREVRSVWSRDHDFQVEISPQTGSMLIDEALFRHIVENLLTNAFLYTPQGGRIRFQAEPRGDQLWLEVTDQGLGIVDEDLPRIFDAFFRGSNVGANRGLGLGLNIVKATVERLGGNITLTSQPGRGTTFRIILPLTPNNR